MTASAYPSRRGSVSFQHTVSARRTALSIGTSTQKRRNPVQYSTTFGQNLASCIGGPVWTPWNSLPTLLHPLKATAVTPTIPTSPGVYFVRWGSSLHIPNLYAGMSVVPVAPAAIKSAINPKLFILCSNNADISLLYIGKAMNLRKRIRQFYRSSLYYASIAGRIRRRPVHIGRQSSGREADLVPGKAPGETRFRRSGREFQRRNPLV